MKTKGCVLCAVIVCIILLTVGFNSLYGLWFENGTPVCAIPYDQMYPQIVADGEGGAIIAYVDDQDIFAQRVDSLGNVLWLSDGVAICTAYQPQYDPKIVTDGAGGAIIIWEDSRYLPLARIYLQRVDSSGIVRWATNGIPLSTSSFQNCARIISDSAGGAIVAWQDGLPLVQ